MIRLHALGPAQLTGDGDEKVLSVLAQPKRLALLVYLAAADPPGFHRRDELVALFWPERDAGRARAALRKSLHHLRKSLGAQALPGRGDEIRVDPDLVWSDVQAFRQAAGGNRPIEALELYRGELLEGFHAADCPGFERWLAETRPKLQRTATSVALEAADVKVEAGSVREAADLARRAAALSPFDETVHRRVLGILDAMGDSAGALRFHTRFAERLAEELDVAPAPETEALVAEIRDRNSLRDAADDTVGAQATGAVSSSGPAPIDFAIESRDSSETSTWESTPVRPQSTSEPAVAPQSGFGWRGFVRTPVGLVLLALLVVALGVSASISWRAARQRWAFDEALPGIQRLIDDRRMVAAYLLTLQVEPYLEANPEFRRLRRQSLSPIPFSVRTDPPGARVSVTDYATPDGVWHELGTTPLERVRSPGGTLRLRVEAPGFYPVEQQFRPVDWSRELVELELDLQAIESGPPMARVPEDGPTEVLLVTPPEEPGVFWLDQHEVTNAEYAAFVAAGSYADSTVWREPVVEGGVAISWRRAMATFVDKTGRPGPATWELGSYPVGFDEHPVGGVSWYEAEAYCRWVGKRLPTIHHWNTAAGFSGSAHVISFSNLESEGTMPVGSSRGVGTYGHVDMAGNVREWALNPIEGNRYILGGGWSDAGYMFQLPDAASPMDRSPRNGLRCARFPDEEAAVLAAEIPYVVREFDVPPVDEEEFDSWRRRFAYPPRPLNATRDSVDDAVPYWRREIVSFDAPYGSERVEVHLFLPKGVDPPYRAVVFYPGATPFRMQSTDEMETMWFDFLVRTGFAVVHPIYEGHFGREQTRLFRERMTHWSMDIGRSIDYLLTRDDFDSTKIAFYGHSFGGWNGPIFTAMEPRFGASVFFAAGALESSRPPELQPLNYAPRATVPVLMVNGRNDFYYGESAQRRLFDLLGAPDEHKRHVMLEGGHFPSDWPGVMREIIGWLERYLGPAE